MNICVVVPVYNSPYINDVIEELLSLNYNIIVVNDGSDNGVDIDSDNVDLINHDVNKGKGEAILSGAKRAKELGYDFIITFDADKQHIASEIYKLVNYCKDNTIVIGNRNFDSDNVPGSSKFGRSFSNFWVMLETFKSLKDTQSGFRLYPVNIIDLPIINKRFDFEIEVLVLHHYFGGLIEDVEVDCYYPPKEERVSHFDKFSDNLRISILHFKLMIQRYILFRGWLWK